MDNEQGAHAGDIYAPHQWGVLYTVRRGLLFVTDRQAVQSLGVVTTIVPTLSFFINRFHLGIVKEKHVLWRLRIIGF